MSDTPQRLTLTAHDAAGTELARASIDLAGGDVDALLLEVVDANGQPLTTTNGDETVESLVIAAHAARDSFRSARRSL